jgi:hypothetical protein
MLFQEYDFEILVKLGRMNKGPNHLSRMEHGKEPTGLEDTLMDIDPKSDSEACQGLKNTQK